jgi:polar amino acid transport system permease protein
MMEFGAQAEWPSYLAILLQGAGTTIALTSVALVIASIFGLILALMRHSRIRVLDIPARIVVNTIRGIPILVQLFYIYFVLPDAGIDLSAFQAGCLGLGIAYGCYMAENFRAGLNAIDPGQTEAAHSIGMGWWLTLRRVTLPQAVKVILPPYGNTMIMLLKDSSQASVITVAEMSFQGKMLAASTFQNMTVYTMLAALYLCLSLPLIALSFWLEKRGRVR